MSFRKLLSILLVLLTAVGMLHMSAFASGSDAVCVGITVVDTINGNIEIMHKRVTAEPGLALKYLDGQYGESIGQTVEIGENEVTPIDVLVAAHLDEYGALFTDDTAEEYITGFDYLSKIFGKESEVTFTANGIMPYLPFDDENNTVGYDIGYAVNQYVVKPGDEICFYRVDYMAYPPSVYASFDKTEYEVTAGTELTVGLGYCAPLSYVNTPSPAPDAEIFMLNDDGSVGSKIKNTDENGNVSLCFENAGTYFLTCGGSVTYSADVDWDGIPDETAGILSPAYTKIVVKEKESDTPPVQTGKYDVRVFVGPADINIEVYECAGFDENGYDILGEKISIADDGINEETSYHTYSMKLDKGTYSFRAKDAEGESLGGMTFDVLPDSESEITEIYLRQVKVYTTTKIDGAYANESQYTSNVKDASGNLATPGKAYVDSSSKTIYPYLLCAGGNDELYTVELIPSDEVSKAYNLGTNTMINYAVSKGTTPALKSATLPTLINAVITAPSGSRIQVFRQMRNFYTVEVLPESIIEEDGIVTCTFRLPKGNSNHTYRVSLEGKITKAGYLNLSTEEKAKTDITFAENENPKIRPEYDRSSAIGSRIEDSILLNINPQNYLRMNIGDTFKARAYRAWQIVNSDTGNIMIEPDFEYKIISGDSITLDVQGQNAVITAVKNGISLVEVTYDAVEIGGNTRYTGIYGAIDPMRKGLFVVNVGGNTDTVISMPKWDSDFDTIYFTGDFGTYDFMPASEKNLTVACNGDSIEKNADGSFTLPIHGGNNIVSVTAGETTEYVIIKGKKTEVTIENATSPGKVLKAGDTANISFEGLHMPIPKFSGIYNPGYGRTVRVSYVDENGNSVQGAGTQYNFITDNTVSVTVDNEGCVKLKNGTIQLTSMGFAPGSHRELTDTGIGANFSASAVSATHSYLPDISFEVLKADRVTEVSTSCESGMLNITFTNKETMSLKFFVAAYSGNKMTNSKVLCQKFDAGENTLVIDISEFKGTAGVRLFVWDENLSPAMEEINIELE